MNELGLATKGIKHKEEVRSSRAIVTYMEDKVTRKRIVGRIPIIPTGDQKDGRLSSRIVTQRMSLLIRQIPQKMNVLSAVN